MHKKSLEYLVYFTSLILLSSSVGATFPGNSKYCNNNKMAEDYEYYFAYGSNLNPDRMREREAFFIKREYAVLPGYKLVFAFNSGSGFGSATLIPDENSDAHGALYTLEKGGLDKLDIFEWVPRGGYERKNVKVRLSNGEMKDCIAYFATKQYFKSGLIPSKKYLDHLLKGKDILPSEYYSFLENHEYGIN